MCAALICLLNLRETFSRDLTSLSLFSKLCIVSFSFLMPFFLAIPQEFIDLPCSSVPLVCLCLFLIFDHCLIQDVYILTWIWYWNFFVFFYSCNLKTYFATLDFLMVCFTLFGCFFLSFWLFFFLRKLFVISSLSYWKKGGTISHQTLLIKVVQVRSGDKCPSTRKLRELEQQWWRRLRTRHLISKFALL